ncbi:MAG: kelch repeat-containing protein [Planctomycetota bacterium]
MSCADPIRKRVWMYNGKETWAWDGTDWSLQTTSTYPPRRWFTRFAFDPGSGLCILFGGQTHNGQQYLELDEAWAWDGKAWTLLAPSLKPPARSAHGLVSDPDGSGLVMFGGRDATNAELGDTWRFAKGSWTALAGTGTPYPGKGWKRMVMDTVRDRPILVEAVELPTRSMASWEFDGDDWLQHTPKQVPPLPPALHRPTTPLRRRVTLFGGNDGT